MDLGKGTVSIHQIKEELGQNLDFRFKAIVWEKIEKR